jgi:aminoglycoside phosphotransferase (APT) family kinase protein
MSGGEVPLRGGRTTSGVVRIGDTVRRPPSTNAHFVRSLLGHLSHSKFGAAPIFLGVDDRGRDVLSFIEGEVPADLAPHEDRTLRQAASIIRRFHDIGADFVATLVDRPADSETVCHNDLSPCNFVFRDGVPVAIIDFDAAAPGSRIHDLGYAAWLWLDLGDPEIAQSDQRTRLATFIKAYGIYEADEVVSAVLRRQKMLAAEGRRTGKIEMADWADRSRDWTERCFDRQPR